MPEIGQVALCRWGGDQFRAEYVGPAQAWPHDHLMKAHSNTPRFSAGTEIHVNDGEIIEWLAAPPPAEAPKFLKEPDPS